MKTTATESIAQFAEGFLQRIAFSVLLMAVGYALSAAMHLVGTALQGPFDLLQSALSVLAAAIVLPGMLRMLRLRWRGNCDFSESDSYMGEVYRQACVMAFSATFVALLLTGPASNHLAEDLSTEFYIQAVLALSLGVFSATFFAVLWRDRDRDGDEFAAGD